jgi:hypothetical protein
MAKTEHELQAWLQAHDIFMIGTKEQLATRLAQFDADNSNWGKLMNSLTPEEMKGLNVGSQTATVAFQTPTPASKRKRVARNGDNNTDELARFHKHGRFEILQTNHFISPMSSDVLALEPAVNFSMNLGLFDHSLDTFIASDNLPLFPSAPIVSSDLQQIGSQFNQTEFPPVEDELPSHEEPQVFQDASSLPPQLASSTCSMPDLEISKTRGSTYNL